MEHFFYDSFDLQSIGRPQQLINYKDISFI